MKVNVVMLVKDRPRLTQQALYTLYRSTDPELFNLTIVDDGGREHLGSAKQCPDNYAVLRINQSRGITGQARNLGVYWAEKYWGRGDWLYLSDNDVYFTPGWLEKLTDTLQHVEYIYSLLGGWNHPYMQPREEDRMNVAWNGNEVRPHDAITGASQLMRWGVWDKYGPLDAHAAGVCQGEDWQFCQNIVKDRKGVQQWVGSIYPRVVFNCGLTNSHGQPSVGADLVLKELQEAKQRFPDLYWE